MRHIGTSPTYSMDIHISDTLISTKTTRYILRKSQQFIVGKSSQCNSLTTDSTAKPCTESIPESADGDSRIANPGSQKDRFIVEPVRFTPPKVFFIYIEKQPRSTIFRQISFEIFKSFRIGQSQPFIIPDHLIYLIQWCPLRGSDSD